MLVSHPTWVRGLKPGRQDVNCYEFAVAPYVGAWIETRNKSGCKGSFQVAPYVGAWIETHLFTIP